MSKRNYEFHVQLDRADVDIIRDVYGWGALAKLVRVFVMTLAARIRRGESVLPNVAAEKFVAEIVTGKDNEDELEQPKDPT